MNSPIKLPPLPEPRIVSYQADSTLLYTELRTYDDADMRAYAEQAVRDALAALKIDERAAFEAAVQDEYGPYGLSMLMRDNDGDYVAMNSEWVFWLKRAAIASAPPKENNHAEGADQ